MLYIAHLFIALYYEIQNTNNAKNLLFPLVLLSKRSEIRLADHWIWHSLIY